MDVNKFRLPNIIKDKQVNIPIELTWDNAGRSDGLDEYEADILEKIINPTEDFEVTRYGHVPYSGGLTSTNYEFYFLPPLYQVTAATSNDWVCSYTAETFTVAEIYYFSAAFQRSFFKIDLYDTPRTEDQKIMATIVIPTQQGNEQGALLGTGLTVQNININKPSYNLDYVGDKEGYFVYWLKNPTYVTTTRFYMSAKFFNAKTGEFIRMMNEPQSNVPQTFNFDKSKYFYYVVDIDYLNYEYIVTTQNNVRIGTQGNPIKWYEYINP